MPHYANYIKISKNVCKLNQVKLNVSNLVTIDLRD